MTGNRMNRAVAESSRSNLIDCRTRRLGAEQDSGKTSGLRSVRFVRVYEFCAPGRRRGMRRAQARPSRTRQRSAVH